MGLRQYATMYERLVANTELSEPDNPQSCWVWTGHCSDGGYPRVCVRRDGEPRNIAAHRAMLEEVLGVTFPFDEAGHLCYNTRCVNPDHLEVQTKAHNLAERRGAQAARGDGSWIPTLFPREADNIPTI